MLGAGKNTVEIIIAAKDRTKAAFAKVNTQMKTMKGGTGRLTGAMNGLKGGLSNVSSSLGSFGAALGPVGIAVAAAAVVMATLGGAAIKASLEFEKAFATIRVGTGAAGEALKGLKEDFRAVFGGIPSDTATVSSALAAMNTTTGATSTLLQDLTTNIVEVSRMLGEDGAGNALAFGKAMKQWQIPTESGVELMDQFYKITQDTGIGFGELTGAMNAYGPVLQNAGLTAAESAELFGRLEGSGIAISRVMPGLNAAFRKWADENKNGKVELEATIGAILNAKSHTEALTIATATFGAEGAQRMTTAVRNGTFELSSLGKMLEGTEGIIMKTSEATLQFGDKWAILKNKVMGAIAPIGDVITNVLGNAIERLSGVFDTLQKVAGPVLDLIFIKFKILQAFLSGLAGPIIAALAPLKKAFGELTEKFKGGIDVLQLLKDVTTIVTGVAREFGKAIGWLVAKALTPFTEKLKADIDMLSAFYDKLGPFKDLVGFVTGGIHDLAESFRDNTEEMKTAMDAVDAMAASLEEFEASAVSAPTAILKAWKLAVDALEEGTGSYKEAVSAIDAEIEKLKDQWKTASEEEKGYIEDSIRYLSDKKTALEEQDKVATEYFNNIINGSQKAIEKTKEFNVTIGDTTIEFKGAAAEVVKNADAYEKLQKSAQTLIDLDWSVFTEFEASLPRIDAGLGDMESSFVGLKTILESNIVELENVKQSVIDISEIAAPFLEKGFLDGIKAIGDFASALKDAGSAIEDFSSLQDVSIEGCINFSMHVHDMVSALQILENQMEDLVPAFGNMDSLITDIADAFLYGGGKFAGFADSFSNQMASVYSDLDATGISFMDFKNIAEKAMDVGFITYGEKLESGTRIWSTKAVNDIADVSFAITQAQRQLGEVIIAEDAYTDPGRFVWFEEYTGEITNWGDISTRTYGDVTKSMRSFIKTNYGITVSTKEMYAVMQKPPEEQQKWLDGIAHSNAALTFQMDKQTNALKAQTGQLAKITDALQPYLNFMRTLNELAALSTLSITDLNNGLNSIKDTLNNLGVALSTFDLRPVMESLFGYEITEGADIGKLTGGITKGFTDTMAKYQSEFGTLIEYVSRLSFALSSLVNSFESLTNISKSVLADQTKLKEIFEGIADVMTNFSTEMGGTEGFAQKFADGMDAMLKSAGPLISYFQDNNAAVTQFNTALLSFKTTITTVIDVFEALASVIKRSSDLVVISAQEIEEALSLVDDQLIQIGLYLQTDAWSEIVTQLSAVSKEWEKWAADVDNSMPAFNSATDTFSTLISKIVGLSSALKDMRDMTVLSVRDIDEALKNIPVFLDRFVDALALNMGAIKQSLKDLDKEWALHAEEMKATMPSYEDSTSAIGKLVGSLLSLHSALESLSEIGTISERAFDKGFKSLMTSISNFAVSLSNNVDDLIFSLQKLRTVWVENEAVLFPLIRDFAIITDNLWGVAHNANRMAEEFSNINKNSRTLEEGFKSLIKFINQVVETTEEFYTPEAAAELAGFIKDVGTVIEAFVSLERELDTAMGKIKKAIGSAVGNIEGKISSLDNLIKTAYYSGANIMGGFISGIYSMSDALALAVQRQAAIVAQYLGAESPTELGPLSHLNEWPRNLIQSYSSGIEAEMHTLNSSFAALAPGMGAGSAGGGNRSIVIHNTQYISDKATAEYANMDLHRLLQRHSVM